MRANPDKANLINDSDNNRLWNAWENISRESSGQSERSELVSSAHPEDVTLV